MSATTDSKEDLAITLARHLVKTKYEHIPQEAIDKAKKSTLDTLGACLAASGMVPECREVCRLVKSAMGKRESTIIGFGGRVPAWSAAFVNGGLSHGIEYDDLHHRSMSHPSGALVPATLAIAERLGGVNGKEFLTAIALGQDLIIRLASSPHSQDLDWLPFPVFGVFGTAAACGKLLGFDEDRTSAAIGAALCYSAGPRIIARGTGTTLRAVFSALPAEGGVRAALLAQSGICGPRNSLEADKGFFSAFFQGKYDRNVVLAELGQRFEGADIGYKPWPSCGNTHAPIEATLNLMKEFGLSSDEIAAITVSASDMARGNCEPLEQKQRPKTGMEARFSLPFAVAIAAVKRRVTLDDFTAEGISDTKVTALAQKVMPRLDASLNAIPGISASIVEIKTKNGDRHSKRVDFAYGHPRNPMSFDDIIAKFRDCAAHSFRPVPLASVEQVIEMTTSLEKMADVTQIIRRLG